VDHPITRKFDKPTFFPVARSVNPSSNPPSGFEIVPLALTSTSSWAETDLTELEEGEAVYEVDRDLPGPISLAVAVEKKPDTMPQNGDASAPAGEGETSKAAGLSAEPQPQQTQDAGQAGQDPGRMVVVGDSDFATNAYFDLAGNGDLAISMVQWLGKDDRFISIRPREPEFQPLFLNERKQVIVMLFTLAGLPVLILFGGGVRVLLRKRSL
jgi:ABC-type uncharacterized transport system involved in gliding motility auxiliary subunit